MSDTSSSEEENIIILGGLVLLNEAIKKRKKRKLWSKEWLKKRNSENGAGALALIHKELRLDDKGSFQNYLRMNEDCFDLLLSKIEHKILRTDTNYRECICARDRLTIALRYFATGESYQSLSYNFRVGKSTISQIVPEIVNAIYECMKDEYIKVPTTEEEWHIVVEDFQRKWQFPNCIGALDGKHINFRPLHEEGSYFRNYKGTDSIVLMAIVDANYKFLCIDVGINGRISDGGVYKNSVMSKAINDNLLNIPTSVKLPNSNISTPYILVADDAFPLSSRLMKPFRFHGLSKEQQIYNYRLSRARRVVENAFGILANRFRIFLQPMNLRVEKVEKITIVCCILHNFLLHQQANQNYCDISADTTTRLTSVQRSATTGNRSTNSAVELRNTFVQYFNGVGAVEWQDQMLN